MDDELKRHHLGKVSDLNEGRGRSVRAAGRDIMLCMMNGKPRAFRNFCPHMGGSFICIGKKLQCKMHGAEFDPDGVVPPTPPASSMSKLEEFPLIIEGDDVYAELKEEKNMWDIEY